MSESSMCTSGKACGGLEGGISSQMRLWCGGFMGRRQVSGAGGGNTWNVLQVQGSDLGCL